MRQSRGSTRCRAARVVLAALAVVSALCGAGYAFGAVLGPASDDHAGGAPRSPTADAATVPSAGTALGIRVRGGRRTVVPGGRTTYLLLIARDDTLTRAANYGHRRFASQVSVTVSGQLPAGVTATLRPRTTRSRSTALTITTGIRTRTGTYRLRLEARSRLHSPGRRQLRTAHAYLTLVVAGAPRQDFAIEGDLDGRLAPGLTAPVQLRIVNPRRTAIRIGELTVRIDAIHAPEATATRRCTARDFTISQFSGHATIRVAALSRSSLYSLGVAAARRPSITMTNRPANQDGCKHATLKLGFSGVSKGPA